ncbi:anti-sigma factor [Marinomonas piezotolerans]|uniref:Anti-sigma factor n=1 Tax=Marinomonas piezotolerans TaxID=2213058 RepID=A0A370UCE1_9GAMM|nr:ChrR family anti-sigma-E factor [Marinomonas piezotolerans]RDL45419.1 anti-sigma factor [Marinomonas piezotolerans]
MLCYHPSLDMLTDYSSGSLSLPHALGVSAHLDQCADCREQLRRLNTLGAELFAHQETTAPEAKLDSLKASLMEKIGQQPQPTERRAPAVDERLRSIPASLRRLIPNGYDELDWMSLTPSFKLAMLSNEPGGAQVALSRIKAGAHMPTHTHTGNEITLVLSGAFSDEDGVYRKGDFICRNDDDKHRPRVTKDAECICLIVLDAPIEFTGWFTRLLNPIMRRFHPSTVPSNA